jgi:hypothetical protein
MYATCPAIWCVLITTTFGHQQTVIHSNEICSNLPPHPPFYATSYEYQKLNSQRIKPTFRIILFFLFVVIFPKRVGQIYWPSSGNHTQRYFHVFTIYVVKLHWSQTKKHEKVRTVGEHAESESRQFDVHESVHRDTTAKITNKMHYIN